MSFEPAMDHGRYIEDGRATSWSEIQRQPAYPPRIPETKAVSGTDSLELRQVADAACRSIPLDGVDLTRRVLPGPPPGRAHRRDVPFPAPARRAAGADRRAVLPPIRHCTTAGGPMGAAACR